MSTKIRIRKHTHLSGHDSKDDNNLASKNKNKQQQDFLFTCPRVFLHFSTGGEAMALICLSSQGPCTVSMLKVVLVRHKCAKVSLPFQKT